MLLYVSSYFNKNVMIFMRNQSSDVVQLQDHNTHQQILFYCLNLC